MSIAIVEDDEAIREGLAYIIKRARGFKSVSTFSSGEEALQHFRREHPQIVLMDIGLPGMNGIDCLRKMKQIHPDVSVVMLTVFEDNEQVFNSIMAGASGYVLKKTPPPKLLELLQDLRHGGAPMSPQIARRVLDFFQRRSSEKDAANLSKREVEILDELMNGCTDKQIADRLHISTSTVHDHLKNVYQKLHVHSRTEAIAKAMRFKPIT